MRVAPRRSPLGLCFACLAVVGLGGLWGRCRCWVHAQLPWSGRGPCRPRGAVPPRQRGGRCCRSCGPAEGGQEQGETIARVQLPLSEKFGLGYTCGKCDTRHVITVNRIAWRSGVVVATCRGCGARHLLADNMGLLDLDNDTGFTNIVQLVEAQGDSVMRVDPSNSSAMAALNLGVGPDGKVRLLEANDTQLDASGREDSASASTGASILSDDLSSGGEEDAPASVAAPAAPALLSPPADGLPGPSRGVAPSGGVGPEEVASESEEEELEEEPITFRVPDGSKEGDVFRIQTEFGRIHVGLPAQAHAGCQLQVEGMVEVGLPSALAPGEVAAVNLPDGTTVQVPMPEGADAGSMLLVGYPVTVLAR